jgi:hypothetical protein
VFIANDWHTALLPVYLKAYYHDNGFMIYARSVLVIHNIAHQVSLFLLILPSCLVGIDPNFSLCIPWNCLWKIQLVIRSIEGIFYAKQLNIHILLCHNKKIALVKH